jgi:hypothetical protein
MSMHSATDVHPFESDLGPDDGRGALVQANPGRACLLRHLVVAAEEIAGERRYEPDAPRYVAIAARLRDMGLERDGESDGPRVDCTPGRPQPLLGLLGEAWLRRGGRLPVRNIDPELIEAAVELLLGIAWWVPGGVPGRG